MTLRGFGETESRFWQPSCRTDYGREVKNNLTKKSYKGIMVYNHYLM